MTSTGNTVPDLRIERIETIPVRVPLDRVYKGSHYQMTHRSTIITRIHTAGGIVGEAYAGDEDAGKESEGECAGSGDSRCNPEAVEAGCAGRRCGRVVFWPFGGAYAWIAE